MVRGDGSDGGRRCDLIMANLGRRNVLGAGREGNGLNAVRLS